MGVQWLACPGTPGLTLPSQDLGFPPRPGPLAGSRAEAAGRRVWSPWPQHCVVPLRRARLPGRGAGCAGTARERCGAHTAPPPSTGDAISRGAHRGPGECVRGRSGLHPRGAHAQPGLVPLRRPQVWPALQVLHPRAAGPRGGRARSKLCLPDHGARQGQWWGVAGTSGWNPGCGGWRLREEPGGCSALGGNFLKPLGSLRQAS